MTAPRAAPWFRRVSFRSRLSLLAAAAVGLALALAAFSAYFAVRHLLYDQTDSSLSQEGGDVYDAASASPHGLLGRGAVQAMGHILASNDYAELVTPGGTLFPLGSGPNLLPLASPSISILPVLPATTTAKGLAQPAVAGDDSSGTATVSGQRFRTYTIGLGLEQFTTSAGQTYRGSVALVVYTPLNLLDHTLSDLRVILLLVGVGGVAVALLLGYLAARAMIRPVERLTAAAEHVAATQNLDATIDEEGQDELARLAHSFNAMLGALGASRQQQAQLVADAGHELRTPLTSLRTNIEVLMRMHQLPPDDRAALLGDVSGQLEELTTLVGDVVELAREDEQESEPVELPFDGIVGRAVERARRRAPALIFTVRTEPGLVRAQPALLERAVLNVLDNAAKWSPPGGTIDVTLRRQRPTRAAGGRPDALVGAGDEGPRVGWPGPVAPETAPAPGTAASGAASGGPEAVRPEAVRPEAVRPEAVRPETVRPETVRPETVRPEAVRPVPAPGPGEPAPAGSLPEPAPAVGNGAPAPWPPPVSGRWELDVRDRGPGIDPEDIPRVFDRFYRASSARSMPGSGLGLAIVRQVVRSHGGDVWVASPPEGGTLVHLEVPLVPEDPTSAGATSSPAVQPAAPAR